MEECLYSLRCVCTWFEHILYLCLVVVAVPKWHAHFNACMCHIVTYVPFHCRDKGVGVQ